MAPEPHVGSCGSSMSRCDRASGREAERRSSTPALRNSTTDHRRRLPPWKTRCRTVLGRSEQRADSRWRRASSPAQAHRAEPPPTVTAAMLRESGDLPDRSHVSETRSCRCRRTSTRDLCRSRARRSRRFRIPCAIPPTPQGSSERGRLRRLSAIDVRTGGRRCRQPPE